ncbi:MAG: hypothetical protein QOJ19_1712 [Acidimicrobiia bacterium]|nr:hypothetical protein [Acidimicrobiia bacterium]
MPASTGSGVTKAPWKVAVYYYHDTVQYFRVLPVHDCRLGSYSQPLRRNSRYSTKQTAAITPSTRK